MWMQQQLLPTAFAARAVAAMIYAMKKTVHF
jgi:hypothetical protein